MLFTIKGHCAGFLDLEALPLDRFAINLMKPFIGEYNLVLLCNNLPNLMHAESGSWVDCESLKLQEIMLNFKDIV